MKKYKALTIILGTIVVLVYTSVIVWLLMMCGVFQKPSPPKVTQSLEHVKSIELLDTDDYEENLLYSLSEDEFEDFWAQFMTLEFGRFVNDPSTEFGKLAVKITYIDGGSDIIGVDINRSIDAKGDYVRTGWYFLLEESDYIDLFSQYVDPSLLPEPR